MVYKPKIKAGIVTINLKARNTALLLKHLHFYNKPDARWVQLIKDTHYHELCSSCSGFIRIFLVKGVISLCDDYIAITRCEIDSEFHPCFGIFGR
jgi:hypothetical protein